MRLLQTVQERPAQHLLVRALHPQDVTILMINEPQLQHPEPHPPLQVLFRSTLSVPSLRGAESNLQIIRIPKMPLAMRRRRQKSEQKRLLLRTHTTPVPDPVAIGVPAVGPTLQQQLRQGRMAVMEISRQ
jgi:hypothetical protein